MKDLFDGYHVVAGANLLGLGPALSGKPFILWLATTLDSELSSRCLAERTIRQKLSHLLYRAERPVLTGWEKLIFSKSASVFGISPFTVATIIEKYPFVTELCDCAPVPVDSSAVKLDSVRPEIGRVIFAGRVCDPRKDIGTLLRAASVARKEIAKFKLVLIGGELPAHLVNLAQQLGLLDCVEVLGHVPDPGAEYRRSDVMVIPSIQEGLNIAGLEALAHRVPVITTRCGGPESYVIDNCTGIIVPKKDPEAIAKAMVRIVNDRHLREKMGYAGRDLVARKFSPGGTLRRFLQEYERVFSSSRPVML